MTTRTATGVLKANVSDYVSGMKKATVATNEVRKANAKATSEIEKNWGNLVKVASIGAVAVAVKRLTDSASNLNETLSKSGVVFGSSASALQQWSATSATAIGQSQQAALEAAATFGNLFVAMKIGQAPAADMSKKLVILASDLASFNNVSPDRALEALRSGLVGETEPLRQFGVNLSAAAIEARALELGLAKTAKTMTPAAKAQAAYSLILEQTTTAQGDFARTSGGLANQQRILNAQYQDAQAALGKNLLPAMTTATNTANNLLTSFNALPSSLQNGTVAVIALGAAALIAVPKVLALKAAMAEAGVSGGKFAGAMKGLGIASVAAAVGLPIVGEAVDKVATSMYGATVGGNQLSVTLKAIANGKDVANVGQFGNQLGSLKEEIDGLISPATTTRIAGFFGTLAFQGGDARRNKVLDQIKAIDSSLAGMAATSIPSAKAAFDNLARSEGLNAEQQAELLKLLPQYRDALYDVSGAATTADVSVAAMANTTWGVSTASNAVSSAVSATSGVIGGLITTASGYAAAMANVQEQLWAARDAQIAFNVAKWALPRASDGYMGTGGYGNATGGSTNSNYANPNIPAPTSTPRASRSGGSGRSGSGGETPAQKRARLAKEAADARAARIKDAKGAFDSAVSDRNSAAASNRDSLLGQANLTGSFDFSKYASSLQQVADAKRAVADAEDAVFAARRKMNGANSDEERAAAADDLAKATRDLAGAKGEQSKAEKDAAASKPTVKNIIKSFADRAKNLASFRTNIATLAKMGLNSGIIQEIIGAFGSGGEDYAAALVKAKPADIKNLNKIQNNERQNASALGKYSAGISNDAAVTGAAATYARLSGSKVKVTRFASTLGNGVAPVVLNNHVKVVIDGREVAAAIAVADRRRGR